ncbi:MAG: polysaccharide biosynthesis/export family protein [Candidatus Methylomirabilia bacterium]
MRIAHALALGLLLGVIAPAAAPAATDLVHELGPRDLIQIKVYQQPDLTQEIRIDDDGTVTLPLVGQVRASGLTVEAFARTLTERYREYLLNPEITVFVKEYNKREIEISVLGEVGKSGFFRFVEKSTLLDVLAQSGGLKPESGNRVIVLRPKQADGNSEPETFIFNSEELYTPSGVKNLNIELLDGDTVMVPRADQYFIFGEVVRPGAYKLDKGTQLTVLKAIILAGGFTDKASKRGVKVTREDGDQKNSIKADLETLVRSQDIIIVPESFF